MTSKWALYIKEREGKSMFENEAGFATYYFKDKWCYIEDVFILPEYRNKNSSSQFGEEIAKIALKEGYKLLLTSVDLRDKNASRGVYLSLKNGFKPIFADGQLIYFEKEIKGE